MRKAACVSLLAVALLLVATVPSDARGRHGGGHRHSRHFGVRSHVFIGVGPGFFYAPYPYWWYYPPPYYAYYPPPPVVVQEPPVYIEQQQPSPPPPPPAGPSAYWYYCASAQAYYPNVQTCPEAWIRVPPRAGQN